MSSRQERILCALATGYHLKAHRYLDGTKVCHLHAADGEIFATLCDADVATLESDGLIAGNMKFPAATYLLTQRGALLASALTQTQSSPLGSRMPTAR